MASVYDVVSTALAVHTKLRDMKKIAQSQVPRCEACKQIPTKMDGESPQDYIKRVHTMRAMTVGLVFANRFLNNVRARCMSTCIIKVFLCGCWAVRKVQGEKGKKDTLKGIPFEEMAARPYAWVDIRKEWMEWDRNISPEEEKNRQRKYEGEGNADVSVGGKTGLAKKLLEAKEVLDPKAAKKRVVAVAAQRGPKAVAKIGGEWKKRAHPGGDGQQRAGAVGRMDNDLEKRGFPSGNKGQGPRDMASVGSDLEKKGYPDANGRLEQRRRK
ncbi:hypothetical protein P280DRAFT_469976 [Massarina eburnea CBS 473.64]|uniref:Uncharacterized protein n=1 Tax=Massarina eburnea CBS 473.64 TaxID=1395130 RepID=A0A6A6S0T9_9PLEO|nr:hypothetical protein P280DRAFT_469976 [Massarina eburnea CBS 473.64]